MSKPGPFLIDNLAVLAENVMHGDGMAFGKEMPTLYDYEGVDFGERFNAAIADLKGGSLYIPPEVYVTTTEPFLTGTLVPMAIYAHGATVKTVGAISGMKIQAGATVRPVDIYGLHVDHTDNADALYGINIEGSWHVRLHSPTLVGADVSANYAAIRIANADPADNGTGSFWCKVHNPQIRRRGGADGDRVPIGILLEGSANATSVLGGGIGADVCISARNHAGQTTTANALLVDGVAFEGYGTAIAVAKAVGGSFGCGHRYVNNRFEAGTTVIDLTGVPTEPAVPFYLSGNFMTSDAGAYLVNPNGITVNSLDMSITPSIPGVGMTWKQTTLIKSQSGTLHPLTVRPSGGARGIKLENSAGDAICQLLWTGTGTAAEIRGVNVGLHMGGIAGINGAGTTRVNNLRGSATFATSGTRAVTFGTAEADALYHIVVTGNVDENFWVTSKATTGFTINSSNASSTAAVDWILIR